MGRIPGFKDAIFPDAAMPQLNLVANLGLVLFLFIIGLEVDLRFLVSNWKVALNVGIVSMAIPFGFGCAIAVGLYNEFRHEQGVVPIDFPVYMLFIGVAMAITVRTKLEYCQRCALTCEGFPGVVPHPDRVEIARYSRGCNCPVRGRGKRRCW